MKIIDYAVKMIKRSHDQTFYGYDRSQMNFLLDRIIEKDYGGEVPPLDSENQAIKKPEEKIPQNKGLVKTLESVV